MRDICVDDAKSNRKTINMSIDGLWDKEAAMGEVEVGVLGKG